MPTAPTYPGVYIEEIPSGVHTITGVSTSITAFIGFTPRGSVNVPVHVFSFADFERAFGGLAVDCPLTYAVKHFFQNGGSEAYVVRVAENATAAKVNMQNRAGTVVLEVTAATAGTWGNTLQIDLDYNTANPASLFNFAVTEFVEQNGQMVPGQTEVFRNLSMNSLDPAYVVATVNAGSALVTVARPSGLVVTGNGKSRSGPLVDADLSNVVTAARDRLAFSVNGNGPFEITLAQVPAGLLPARLGALATDLKNKIDQKVGGSPVTVAVLADGIEITSANVSEASAIHFFDAPTNSATAALKLGLANGGIETDGAATFRPVQTGTVAGGPPINLPIAAGTIGVNVFRVGVVQNAAPIPLQTPLIPSAADAAGALRDALAASPNSLLAGATASMVGGVLRVLPGAADPNLSFAIVDVGGGSQAANLALTGPPAVRNVARYAPGGGIDDLSQVGSKAGSNGVKPSLAKDVIGKELDKTGIYALEKVDLFNILVMPDTDDEAVQMEAVAYCTRRRAFMIIDAPATKNTFAKAQAWIATVPSGLRSRNAALYFPRLVAPDPLMNGAVGTYPAAGALAGLYARTDGERGVWKAPAGTAATIVGATGLTVTLTDKENGTLNPVALNCLRTFPVIGTVSWGARTARGADILTDEYKYIPIRRLALFMEESLYRGTQWVVFEPNDEPLWAQIRLNLSAFMQTLYAEGAFQGSTAREAYFVKCDKETTTQNHIDLGQVNIVVGFAPLKPAEFVIIKIQQIAGAIRT